MYSEFDCYHYVVSLWNNCYSGKTVRSEDFDLRLMIVLLNTLANIKVCDSYPLPTDTSTGAMLSRIKYIRNETTQNVNGKLTEDQFNQYWDDIRQVRCYIIHQCFVVFIFTQHIRLNVVVFDLKNVRRFFFFIQKKKITTQKVLFS